MVCKEDMGVIITPEIDHLYTQTMTYGTKTII